MWSASEKLWKADVEACPLAELSGCPGLAVQLPAASVGGWNHRSQPQHTGTYLRGDPVTTAGEFDVLKLYWESNGKEQVEDLHVSLSAPSPPPFSNIF